MSKELLKIEISNEMAVEANYCNCKSCVHFKESRDSNDKWDMLILFLVIVAFLACMITPMFLLS